MQFKLYTTVETAKLLQMSVRTLQRQVADKKIFPTKTSPRRNRYTEAEIQRYLKSVTAEEEERCIVQGVTEQ